MKNIQCGYCADTMVYCHISKYYKCLDPICPAPYISTNEDVIIDGVGIINCLGLMWFTGHHLTETQRNLYQNVLIGPSGKYNSGTMFSIYPELARERIQKEEIWRRLTVADIVAMSYRSGRIV